MDSIPAAALCRIIQHVAGGLYSCFPAGHHFLFVLFSAGYEDFLCMMFVCVHWCQTAAGADLQGSAYCLAIFC